MRRLMQSMPAQGAEIRQFNVEYYISNARLVMNYWRPSVDTCPLDSLKLMQIKTLMVRKLPNEAS